MGIGTPRKGFNVLVYNQQKRDREKKTAAAVLAESRLYTDEEIADAIAGTIANNPCLGDEVPTIELEQNGRGSYRLKTNRQIFILRIREEA